MLGRIIRQYQMRHRRLDSQQILQRIVGPGIAVERDEGRIAKQWQRTKNAAAAVERLAFARVGDATTEALAAAEMAFDLLAQVSMIDNDVVDAGGNQTAHVMLYQRHPGDAQHRLRRVIGERPHARAETCGENHRFHGAGIFSSSAASAVSCGRRVQTPRRYSKKRGTSSRYFGLPSR